MNPTVKKRIDLQVARKQLKIQTGSTANFETMEDSSRDLLGKFHMDKIVWIQGEGSFKDSHINSHAPSD
jgi:hypothetical protein